MPKLYDDSDEEALHLDAVESLAEATNHPFAEVKKIYAGEFARLKAEAHITDYLVILTCRRVRDVLAQANRSRHA